MAFTAKDVSALREMTGVGMMDCKKALQETDGDMNKAVEVLREKGMAAAAKKAGRIAAEGMCFADVCKDCGAAAIIEVNSETDFVAKNAEFQAFVKDLCGIVIQEKPADMDTLKACAYPGTDLTVEKVLQEKVLKIGENIQIRRFEAITNPENASYVHMGGKIAVLVHMEVSENLRGNAAVNELGRDVAMQVAAMRPLWLDESSADAETVANETKILTEQVKQDDKNAGKPQQVIDKIVEGRVKKYFSEVCLLNQAYVKENKQTVSQHVAEVGKALGGEIKVLSFVRYEVGEGLQKREENFADEIAKLVK